MKDLKQVLFRKAAHSKLLYERALNDCGKWDETTKRRLHEFELLESIIGECGLIDEFEVFYEGYKNRNKGIYGV